VRACGWYVVSWFIVLGPCWPTAVGIVGIGTQMVIRRCVWYTSVGKSKKTRVRGTSGRVMISVWGILSGTYVWLGLCHPKGLMCERGGVCVPFHVADKAGIGDL